MNDPTYDYVDDEAPTVSYKKCSENITFNEKKDYTYHETVLYHSSGPSTALGGHTGFSDFSRAGAHIYDDASVHILPGGSSQAASMDPVYEDPVVSQVFIAA